MDKDLTTQQFGQEQLNNELERVLRTGARQLLQQAIEVKVANYIAEHVNEKDEAGHRLVVRNGFLPERTIQTGLGPIEIEQPRVREKREGEKFSSNILPRYARKAPSIETVIPVLYLKGVSTGDFSGPCS